MLSPTSKPPLQKSASIAKDIAKNIIILKWFGDTYKKTSILKPDL